MKTDVLIIGGGAVGASVAYFLGLLEPGVDVTVVERDSSYQFASTPRASGGVRRLFSLPENIELSNFSIRFFEDFPTTMALNGEPAESGGVRPRRTEQLRRPAETVEVVGMLAQAEGDANFFIADGG